ncbi:hypothetical protein ACFW33_25415, partial [Streptomyces sp. NPDC058830]|uniref:hypothetical protein n=1 Tax=Streptomyces sp. NPDC058830 TaxID=3346645 RepID=UPI0036A4913A
MRGVRSASWAASAEAREGSPSSPSRPRREPAAQAAATEGRPGSVSCGAAVRRAGAGAVERRRTVSPLAVVVEGVVEGAAPPDGAAEPPVASLLAENYGFRVELTAP